MKVRKRPLHIVHRRLSSLKRSLVEQLSGQSGLNRPIREVYSRVDL